MLIRFIRVLGAVAIGAAAAVSVLAADKPNIVFILADDLGFADVAFHGGTAPTPHLDKLAREGLELTQHYVAATCSPTRAGLLTGRFWSRYGIAAPESRRVLPWDTITLARALKSVGYETALMGKWHLGSRPEWGPDKFGFDHAYGSLGGGVGPYDHFYKKGEFSRTWHRNGELIPEEGHVTDLIADEATKWIARRGDQPFFLYLPFTAVHLPLKEPQEWLERVPAAITGDVARHYAASVMHLDDAVGRILQALDQTGKREQTLVVFTSDNGGSTVENNDTLYPDDHYPRGKLTGNNRPWRGEKGDLYEGGIHVAAIAHWPGHVKAGRFEQPIHIVDWMPTLCALAGYRAERELRWDGANAWPQLSGATNAKLTRTMYWTSPRASAVRDGDWKLIVHRPRGISSTQVELFNIAADPSEKTNVATKHPERVAELTARLAEIAKADRDSLAND